METENEKSIEQIAMESYALNVGWKKSRKLDKIFGIVISCLAVPLAIMYLDPKIFGEMRLVISSA